MRHQNLAKQLKEGVIGEPLTIHTIFRDHPCPPIEFLKTGGDPFHDLATHDIDFVLSMVDEEPTEVVGFGTSLVPELREVGVMDTASVILKFPSGLICTMELSRNSSYGYDQRVEVFGSNGSFLAVENMQKDNVVAGTPSGLGRSGLVHSFPQRFNEAYQIELDKFVDMIAGIAEPPVKSNQAIMASIVAEAALQSAVKGTVVRLLRGREADNSVAEGSTDIYFETMERTGVAQEAHTVRSFWPAQ